jgi:thiamine kinase-like enzyme
MAQLDDDLALETAVGAESPSLKTCLPARLQSPTTTLTRIAAGLSGASVYKVEADGQTFVLKIASEDEPLADWRHRRHIQEVAANAGLAPRLVHADEARRALLSEFVVDRSFPAYYGDPRTHEIALVHLAQTLRRVHALPLSPQAPLKDPRQLLASLWSGPLVDFVLPIFVGDTLRRVLDEAPPPAERASVLSHNDVNPTNLVYDGARLLLLDWDTAGRNDPFYDLATISVFLRMDDSVCLRLLAAYDGAASVCLPAGLAFNRRVVAALCGAVFLHLARRGGQPGAAGTELFDATPSLGEVYQRMRAGSLDITSAEGKWWLGLALVKVSASLREGNTAR